MAPSNRCCCGCSYLVDTFARTTENIAEDEVNFLGSTIWKLTDDDWIVGVGTGRLLCQASGSPIYFYNESGVGTSLNTFVNVTLYEVADTFTMILGSQEIKFSFPSSTKIRLEVAGGAAWEREYASPVAFPFSGTFGVYLFNKETYEAKNPGQCYLWGSDILQIWGSLPAAASGGASAQFNSNCTVQLGELDLSSFDKYGFKAEPGVTVQDVTVVRARPDCATQPPVHCRTACYPSPLPTTISAIIGDLKNSQTRCTNIPAANACTNALRAERDAYLGACSATLDACIAGCSGPGYGACVSACQDAWTICHDSCFVGPGGPCYRVNNYCLECYAPNSSCKGSCDCESVNGSYTLTRENGTRSKIQFTAEFPKQTSSSEFGECDCVYSGIFSAPSGHALPFYQNDDCGTRQTLTEYLAANGYDATAYLIFRIRFNIAFYDCTTGIVSYSYTWINHPLGSPGPGPSQTNVVGFCGGETKSWGSSNNSTNVQVYGRKVSTGVYEGLGSPSGIGQACSCFAATFYLGPCPNLPPVSPTCQLSGAPVFGSAFASVSVES